MFGNTISTYLMKFLRATVTLDKKWWNVIILSFCFVFLNSVFQATCNIQKTIFEHIAQDDPNFTGDGYVSLSIGNAALSIGYLLTPFITPVVKSRLAILIGSLTNAVYMCSFLWPGAILIYSLAAIQGLGYGLAWIGAAQYIIENSDLITVAQKFGVFYGIVQLSNVVGNLIIYVAFTGTTYDRMTRKIIFLTLIIFAVVSVILSLMLRKPPITIEIRDTEMNKSVSDDETNPEKMGKLDSMMDGMRSFISLITKSDINLLLPIFFYSGIIYAFNTGIFTACVGFTVKISKIPEKLISIIGISIGFGEIIGSIFFKVMASRVKVVFGINWIIAMGVLTHTFSFVTILLNLPDDSPFQETKNVSFISPSPILALIGGLTLGFGNACFNIQIFACIATLYPNDTIAANSYFNFWQSVAMSVAYFYSNYFGLHLQLGILQFTAIFGTILYSVIIMKNNAARDWF